MLKYIEYLHCKPHQLNLFQYGTLDNMKYLTLYINTFVTEKEDCWKSLPPNVSFINLDVRKKHSSTEVVPTTSTRRPCSPYEGKFGGLTFHKDFNSKVIHLNNPHKITFLGDDGTDETMFGNPYLCFNNPPAIDHLAYFRIQIVTEFAPIFVIENPPSNIIHGSKMFSYHSSTYVFKHPQEETFVPVRWCTTSRF
ncbi:unnamed protein product [Ambrosiozyma monospora]|uniref:Unnamed protein product n=1 Tax=Ambrosiozyma monospora TaxID=43982 RepID=A0ACB5TDD3_AMBMO|nr:unnamed protein product [Ambrosiozyma monospora]